MYYIYYILQNFILYINYNINHNTYYIIYIYIYIYITKYLNCRHYMSVTSSFMLFPQSLTGKFWYTNNKHVFMQKLFLFASLLLYIQCNFSF